MNNMVRVVPVIAAREALFGLAARKWCLAVGTRLPRTGHVLIHPSYAMLDGNTCRLLEPLDDLYRSLAFTEESKQFALKLWVHSATAVPDVALVHSDSPLINSM